MTNSESSPLRDEHAASSVTETADVQPALPALVAGGGDRGGLLGVRRDSESGI